MQYDQGNQNVRWRTLHCVRTLVISVFGVRTKEHNAMLMRHSNSTSSRIMSHDCFQKTTTLENTHADSSVSVSSGRENDNDKA